MTRLLITLAAFVTGCLLGAHDKRARTAHAWATDPDRMHVGLWEREMAVGS